MLSSPSRQASQWHSRSPGLGPTQDQLLHSTVGLPQTRPVDSITLPPPKQDPDPTRKWPTGTGSDASGSGWTGTPTMLTCCRAARMMGRSNTTSGGVRHCRASGPPRRWSAGPTRTTPDGETPASTRRRPRRPAPAVAGIPAARRLHGPGPAAHTDCHAGAGPRAPRARAQSESVSCRRRPPASAGDRRGRHEDQAARRPIRLRVA